MLRPFWGKLFQWNSGLGLVLIFLFGIPRFYMVLQANRTGDYRFVASIFLVMWIAPFILLSSQGRKAIGMKGTSRYGTLLFSFLAGSALCTLMFFTANLLIGHSISNWFVYISNSYSAIVGIRPEDKLIYFIIYAVTAMTFSPIGEELLYRGIIHGAFAVQVGERSASRIDSAAFALTHLAHFGIIYAAGSWQFLFLPALLWVFFMYVASILFFKCRGMTGSLLGAMTCHAGFNLAMIYLIFYYIL